jgi:hypothetical protein
MRFIDWTTIMIAGCFAGLCGCSTVPSYAGTYTGLGSISMNDGAFSDGEPATATVVSTATGFTVSISTITECPPLDMVFVTDHLEQQSDMWCGDVHVTAHAVLASNNTVLDFSVSRQSTDGMDTIDERFEGRRQ